MSKCGCARACGCGGAPETGNPPGAATIERRVGTYGDLLVAMRDRLSGPAYPALARLTVRTLDDPATALLDSAAVLGDVLTFYTERIAQEGYLRTATEESSLRLLGGLVGYAPRPGVAAGTFLAYTVDRDAAGRDTLVSVPAGSRAQSVPAAGGQPQPYETSEELAARPSFNDLTVLTRRPIRLSAAELLTRSEIPFAGTTTQLKPGDRLLFRFAGGAGPVLVVAKSVTADQRAGITVVGLQSTTPPSLDAVRRGFAELVERETGAGMHTRSSHARRFVDGVLAAERDELDAVHDPAAFAERLQRLRDRLDDAARPARAFRNVREWFAGVRTELDALADRLPAPQAGPLSETEEPGPGDAALRALAAALAALRKPPSVVPAAGTALERDPAQLYGPGSDLLPQLLAALDPRLREQIFEAWRAARASVTEQAGVQAMRVVANPFGATAPLQQIQDAQGRITGQRDWPLLGAQQLGAQLVYAGAQRPQSGAFSYVEQSVATLPRPASLLTDSAFTLGPFQVTIAAASFDSPDGEVINPGDTAVTMTFAPAGLALAAEVRIEPGDDVVLHVGALELSLGPDDSQSGSASGWTVEARRTDGPTGTTVDVLFGRSVGALSHNVLHLDAAYDGIAPGSWVVIDRPGKRAPAEGAPDLRRVVTTVVEARTVALAAFGISGKVTQLVLDDDWLDDADTSLSDIRDTTVYARGESLGLATEPEPGPVTGAAIELAQLYDGLRTGQWIVVSGERTDVPGVDAVAAAEVSMIAAIAQKVCEDRPGDRVHTELTLAAPLAYEYRRETVHVFANVVPATHGATRDEPIGSGDAAVAGQSFVLFAGPLTWLAADNPLGAEPQLEIRVGGVLWHPADSLAGRSPAERVYVTSVEDDGRTRVTFGDGVQGARLPTGSENVRAHYRVGVGAPGNAASHRITQLATRPLGVSAVDNPVAATGGADADDARALRRGIPLAISALDRLVAVADFADFAESRAGIGRASARLLTDGVRRLVHLTVAGAHDVPLDDRSPIVTGLRAALTRHGDPLLPVVVAVREPVVLLLAARLGIRPDHAFDLVAPRVRATLLDRFGFDARELGQSVQLSEIVAAAQAVPGVDHVDVDIFAGVAAGLTPQELAELLAGLDSPATTVPARPARFAGARGIRPAQLVTFAPDVPDTLILTEARP